MSSNDLCFLKRQKKGWGQGQYQVKVIISCVKADEWQLIYVTDYCDEIVPEWAIVRSQCSVKIKT